MRRRPWILIVLAVLHFLAPIGNIIFNAKLLGRDVLSYFVYALSPEYFLTNWVILVAPVMAGVSIYACKRWSFFVYLIAITTLFIFSFQAYEAKSQTIGWVPIVVVYLINIFIVSYFLLPAVRNIYFDRRMRWWEIQPRYRCDFKGGWKSAETQSESGQTVNISINGLFMKDIELPKDKQPIQVHFFYEGQKISMDGEAIIHRRVDALGFGVQFVQTAETKKQMQKIVRDLEQKGHRLTQLDARPEDSFSFWLRTLLTTGRGLIPKKEK